MSDSNGGGDTTGFHVSKIAEANREAMGYRLKLKDARQQIRDLQAHAAELQTAHDALVTERDTLRGQLQTAPTEWQQKYEEAQRAILERDHRDAFAAVKDQLHDKVDLKKLWAEAGYEPTGAVPDEAKIAEWVGKAREAAPYLFKSDPGGSTQAGAASGQRPGPGAGRGAPDTTGTTVRVTKADLSDPAFMRTNQDRLTAASAAGNLVVTD